MNLSDIGLLRAFAHKDLVNLASVPFNRAYINGGLIGPTSGTTSFPIAACTLNLNGTIRSFAGGTFTSGSTLKALDGSTVTFGASKAYNVFLHWNGSAVVHAAEEIDGSGDGATPVWDDELGYWKAASTGAEARRIGRVLTSGSSVLYSSVYAGLGSERWVFLPAASLQVLTNGTQTSATSVTVTPWLQSDDDFAVYHPRLGISSGTNAHISSLMFAGNATLSHGAFISSSANTHRFGNEILPSGGLSYLVSGSNPQMQIYVQGWRFRA